MRRGALIAAMIIACGAGDAAAKDMDMAGRVGIGGAQTLGGVRGFDIVYWAGKLAVNGTAQLQFYSPSEGDSGLFIALAGGVLFPILSSDHADLSFGGRLDVASAKDRDPQLTIEAPLRIEWYASEHLSLHGEVGVAIEIIGDRRLLSGAGTSFFGSGGGTGVTVGGTFLTAGGGFDVYF